MLKIKLRGFDSIEFNTRLEINGSISGYTVEPLELEGKLCETSTMIYPTAQYESDEDKFVAICTELGCNEEIFVSFHSSDQLVEYVDVNGERFTIKELFELYKDKCTVLYACEYTEVKARKDYLQKLVKCNMEYGCDYCRATLGKLYAFDLDGNKVRLEAFGEDAMDSEDMEFDIHIVTPELMKEIERLEAE